MTVALILLIAVAMLVLGFEMFLVLLVPGILAKMAFFDRIPDIIFIQKLVGGMNHTTLLAIPFFIFAAEIMAHGEIARRLTEVVKRGLGRLRGGMGYTTVGSSMAFGSVSGSAPATVAAIGRLLHPELLRSRFSDRFSLGLIVSSAETALLIPPSITLIIYGWLTGTSIAALFAAGLAVGVVLALAFAALVAWEVRRQGIEVVVDPTDLRQGWRSLVAGGWALGMPVIILGGIYSGTFTPTEAAAVSVVYALFVEMLIYRRLGWRGLMEVARESALLVGVIFLLLAAGSVLAYIITVARLPNEIIGFLNAHDVSVIQLLIVINILFFIAGMFIDPNSAQLILVPTFFPAATAMGIDPVHFGMIVCLNICIGMITPPFGLDIFVASSTLKRRVETIIAGVWPFVAVNIVVLLLVTYVPEVSLFLPNLLDSLGH